MPNTQAADGQHTSNGRPHGFTSLTPFIVVDGADRAIEFYTAVFGAKLLSRNASPPDEEGRSGVMHAELDFGMGILQLSDPIPSYGMVAPQNPPQGISQSIAVYLPDVDAVFARAVELGATVVEAPTDFVSGDRYGTFVDPFGRRWAVMTRVEDISREESERRTEAWVASLAAS